MSHGISPSLISLANKEPHTTLKGAVILNPQDDILEAMVANQTETLIVPYAAYPDFFDKHKDLVKNLIEKKITIVLS